MKFYVLLISLIFYLLLTSFAISFVWLDADSDGQVTGGYWYNPNIELWVDNEGDLKNCSGCDPIELSEQAFEDSWNSVETTSLEFTVKGYKSRSEAGNYTFMYIDDDGSICEEVLGSSCSGVLGVAMSYPDNSYSDGRYGSSTIVINGAHSQMQSKQFLVTVTHEFGHFAGLDHADIYYYDSSVQNKYIPTMFAVSLDENEQLTLSDDDIAGISTIYPNDTFYSTTGAIMGSVIDFFGNPVWGAHLTAIDYNTGYPIVGALTGFPTCFTSTYYTDKPEQYLLTGIPPGDYIIKMDSFNLTGDSGSSGDAFTIVDELRTGDLGSGIGINDYGNFDFAFPTEYYDNLDGIDDAKMVTVKAGSVLTDVDFVTGIDEERSGSILVAIEHPRKSELQIQIGIDNSNCATGWISIDENGANLYKEYDISTYCSYYDDYLPPTSYNRWYLNVKDPKPLNNSGQIVGFKIYSNGKTYISNDCSLDNPKAIEEGAFQVTSVYIDDASEETSSNSHGSIKLYTVCPENRGSEEPKQSGNNGNGGNTNGGSNGNNGGDNGNGTSSTLEAEESGCSCIIDNEPNPIKIGSIILNLLMILAFMFALRIYARK